MTKIRVVVADDQALVRSGLVALLEMQPDITVAGAVANGAELLDLLAKHPVDVALVDVQMPELDGITATEQISARFPNCRVIIVTTFDRTGYLRSALSAGAAGFLVKDTPVAELAEAIRKVNQGGRVIDQNLAVSSVLETDSPLTAREAECLSLAAAGLPIAEVAAELYLSAGTVRNHLSSAISKTGARNRIEAANIALAKGWL